MAPKKSAYNGHHTAKDRKPNLKSWGWDAGASSNLEIEDDVKAVVEEYLSGNRESAVGKYAVILNQKSTKKLRPVLKKSIKSYVKHYRKDFVSSIKITNCVFDLFKNFNMETFIKRAWQYHPYYIHAEDYSVLQTSIKNPVHISNYNYNEPLYKLANNITYSPKALKPCKKKTLETIKNDTKFYLSKDEDILFAKFINLRYKPANLKMVKLHNKDKNAEEKAFAVYDNYLYNRSLSVSMYVLLEGDPNKAMPFVRYDNDPTPHTNIYIGDDKRREIFGDVALNPHFHFQNEDDSLLCLGKFKEDGKTKYKTGRCNAIDCKHLKKYLLDLDALTDKEVERLMDRKNDYDLPFLQYRSENKKVGVNVDKLFYSFLKDKTDEEINKLDEISLWLTHSKDSTLYHNGKSFDKLVRCLDFLDRIALLMDSTIDCHQRKLYSQLEIFVADAVINSICNNTANVLLKDQQPKFTIQTDLLREEKE